MKRHSRHGRCHRRALALTLGFTLFAGLVVGASRGAAPGAGVPSPGPIVYPYVDGATKRSHIYVQLPGEPDARKVYDEPGRAWRAKWSPDGEQIAFANKAIFVMHADGSDVRKVGDQPGFMDDEAFGWGPGANQLTYYEEEADQDGDLWITNVDRVRDPIRLTREGGIFHEPVWSPTGDRLAYVWRPNGRAIGRLFMMDASNGFVTPLASDIWPTDVSWSPDGRELIFVKGRKGNGPKGTDIVVVEAADGARPRRITGSPYDMRAPVFLSDGSWIAFAWSGDVHVMRADGTDRQALGILRGPFLISHFDWHNPLRAVSSAGKAPLVWGAIKEQDTR